jgi:hypothetical protein
VLAIVLLARPAAGQQRPLATEDPEAIGSGRLLIEGGVDFAHDVQYPVSGLEGNLLRLPTIGVSFGLSPIAELQFDGGIYNRLAISSRSNAPLAHLLTVTGDTTHDVEDMVVGTKVRVWAEGANHPSFGFRFATRLPNAQNESGLGLDTMDFYATLLAAKTVQSIRLVGNLGVGILGDPTNGERQNDVLLYSASFARAITDQSEVVGEVTGRVSTRKGDAFPGTESRGLFKVGGRYTRGSIRFDAGLFLGLTSIDPLIGFTSGFTYVFNAFNLP